jgi:membrane-bound acyltransferase YfiQ involved in biofilm formation
MAMCMARPWFVWISAFSFMIYAMHAPLVAYATEGVFSCINQWTLYRIMTYIFLPMVIISLCVGVGALLRRTVPKAYSLLTGGRGI